jgi:hypothetical protein
LFISQKRGRFINIPVEKGSTMTTAGGRPFTNSTVFVLDLYPTKLLLLPPLLPRDFSSFVQGALSHNSFVLSASPDSQGNERGSEEEVKRK